jgi:ribosome-binding protein aMBF1 (putative translation factor)
MTELKGTSAAVDIDTLLKEATEDARRDIIERTFVHDVAHLVRSLRRSAGMNQSMLASALGTTQSAISDIERAAGPHGPTVALVGRIAAACGHRLTITSKPLSDSASMMQDTGRPR